MKKIMKMWLAAILVGLLSGPSQLFAAASGNYTDILPPGAAGDTTVISRGSGWALTTLAPAQTFGDSLSRAPYTAYQSTTAVTFNTTVVQTTMTAIVGQGFVGSTTFPATWVASGRSIRVSIRGNYGTTGSPNWTWGINIGTTTIISTGALGAPTSVTAKPFFATAVLTINATGNTGSISAAYEINATTATANSFVASNVVAYSTATQAATVVDLTTQLVVNPFFTWGTSSSANTVTITNATVEFLN